jgi:nitrate/TMAO reductase-like tetraheme cytochrome c subunit
MRPRRQASNGRRSRRFTIFYIVFTSAAKAVHADHRSFRPTKSVEGNPAVWKLLDTINRNRTVVAVGIAGAIVGVIGWGGFNTAMEVTNTLGFCTSCHEMSVPYEEYKKSVHYSNPSGVRAICSDCHVPKDWTHKVVRKVQATNELWHKLVGTIDTPEKYEAHRLELAKNVWKTMKETDSRECRNCHSYDAMDFEHQKPKIGRASCRERVS